MRTRPGPRRRHLERDARVLVPSTATVQLRSVHSGYVREPREVGTLEEAALLEQQAPNVQAGQGQ
jgi:hypothetical protein